VETLGESGILSSRGIVLASHPEPYVDHYVYQNAPEAEWEEAWGLTKALIQRLRHEVKKMVRSWQW
jgi:hypothetical protein